MSQLYSQSWRELVPDEEFETADAYDKARQELQAAEKSRAFDAAAIEASSDIERQPTTWFRKSNYMMSAIHMDHILMHKVFLRKDEQGSIS